MLSEFAVGQANAYEMFLEVLCKNRISHAYLIETNHYVRAMDFVMSLAKAIICPWHNVNRDNCNGCNKCMRIDEGNYIEIKIIEPSGMWIKKEQLRELQEEFSKQGIEGERRVYIIRNCEKMNPQAANSLLKFLEEPAPNIHAILVTDNVGLLLDTIVSRCQRITLSQGDRDSNNGVQALANLYCTSVSDYNNFVSDDNMISLVNSVVEFIMYLEGHGYNTIIYTKKLWHSKIKERSDNVKAMDAMINFYGDVLRVHCGKEVVFFKDKESEVRRICANNDMSKIVKKIDILMEMRDNIKYNLNINLLIDKLIIEIGGVNDGTCWS